MSPTTAHLQAASARTFRCLPEGEHFACRVSGTSMLPRLREGDEVLARRWAGGFPLRLGDLLVLELPDAGIVVHRLLWRSRGTVRTRGDGSGRMDPAVPNGDVLGRVERVSRDGVALAEPGWTERIAWLRHFAAAASRRLGRRAELALRARSGGRELRGRAPRGR